MKLFKFIFFAYLLWILLLSCDTPSNDWKPFKVGTLLWVNEVMPDSIVKLAVKETLENSSLVVAQISWSPTDTIFLNNAQWYHLLAKESGAAFMLNIDWLENDRADTRGNWDFENAEIKQLFIKDMKQLVDLYQPNYLTLGIEVNYYALTSPAGYNAFIKIYNDLKSYFKENYPIIEVGLSFQLELLYGVHKGWNYNKTVEPLNAIVENLDYIGISTYPDIFYSTDKQTLFSVNYLDSLEKTYNKPMGISETGISSINYNDDERANYITAIYQKAESLNFEFVVWGSIIDDPRNDDWRHRLGLINFDGSYKSEFNIWKLQNKQK